MDSLLLMEISDTGQIQWNLSLYDWQSPSPSDACEALDRSLCIVGIGAGGYNWIGKAYKISFNADTIKSLSVPYIHQVYDTPTGFNGEAACSETAAVMVLAYHGRLVPDPVTCENKWVYGGEDKSLNPPPSVSTAGTSVTSTRTAKPTSPNRSPTRHSSGGTATGAGPGAG
jgi:hypothetical protein